MLLRRRKWEEKLRRIRHLVLYFALLGKRFFKKYSFVVLLCMVPILLLLLKNVSGDGGMLHIALYAENPQEEAVQQIVEQLSNQDSVLRCSVQESEEETRALVAAGEADAAWIFERDFPEKVSRLIAGESVEEPITVIEQEDTVFLQLARMKLFCVIYPQLSYALYRDFAREDLKLREMLSEERLREIYEENGVEEKLFRYAYLEASEAPVKERESYMTAPLRGMLGLLILLCGLAADMFFMQDEAAGVLDGMPAKKRRRSVYVYQLAAMLPVAAAVLLGLWLVGSAKPPGQELLWMALYVTDCMVFCNLVRKICGTSRRMGASIPILMLGMFVLCPVFLTIRKFRLVQFFLPPYYYLTEIQRGINPGGIARMLLYAVIGAALSALPEMITEKGSKCLTLKKN